MAYKDHVAGYDGLTECGRDFIEGRTHEIGTGEFRRRWMQPNERKRKKLCFKCADDLLLASELREYPKPRQ